VRRPEKELGMTNSDLPPAGDTRDRRHAESGQCAISIASDFIGLVAIFERQLEILSSSDTETRAHLVRAKNAAARGADLSQQLIEQMQASN